MAMQVLKHRKRPDGGYRLIVWTDTTKTDADGQPDPEYVRTQDYGPKPDGMTQADYVAMQKRETKLLLKHEQDFHADQEKEGTSLGGEGETL